MQRMTIKTEYLEKSCKNALLRSEKNVEKLKLLDNRFAGFRLISTIIFLATIVGCYSSLSGAAAFITIISFLMFCALLSFIHGIFHKKLAVWRSLVLSYSLSVARINRNFTEIENYKSPWHNNVVKVPLNNMYSLDLDIHTNLFLLLNSCTTQSGSQKLFNLLMSAASEPENIDIVQKRSVLANSLSKNTQVLRRFESIRLRESFLKKYFEENNEKQKINSEENDSYFFMFRNIFAVFSILVWLVIFIPAIKLFFVTENSQIFIQPLFIYVSILIVCVVVFAKIQAQAQKMSDSTQLMFEIIESIQNKKMPLRNLNFSFLDPSAKKKIKQLKFVLDLMSIRGNPIFWVTLHVFLPFDPLLCLFLNLKIKNYNTQLSQWESELHEFDLVTSFAIFARENPTCQFLSFPTPKDVLVTDNSFLCEEIGHPLIPAQKRICNSISLDKSSPIVLLTGSNMAGKSTFLRTVGVNILLANMGAPVCAKQLIVPPRCRLLCAIRIDDSLSEGTSYFYAEVKRLKKILDTLSTDTSYANIFLIDEIFRGTNNKERYIGSYNIIYSLFEKNSFGFISTHDLSLSELSHNDKRMRNMHFREHITDNKLVFDYLIKEGSCPTTNALYIMKSEGLPIFKENIHH